MAALVEECGNCLFFNLMRKQRMTNVKLTRWKLKLSHGEWTRGKPLLSQPQWTRRKQALNQAAQLRRKPWPGNPQWETRKQQQVSNPQETRRKHWQLLVGRILWMSGLASFTPAWLLSLLVVSLLAFLLGVSMPFSFYQILRSLSGLWLHSVALVVVQAWLCNDFLFCFIDGGCSTVWNPDCLSLLPSCWRVMYRSRCWMAFLTFLLVGHFFQFSS